MGTAEQHPDTNLHYVHIFPAHRVFEEIEECYRVASWRMPWMSVDKLPHWTSANPGWMDPDRFLIFWGTLPHLPQDRRARVAHRYTESAGNPEGLIPNQRVAQQFIVEHGQKADLVLAGSPAIMAIIRPHCRNVTLYPIGYEPDVMGVPDWNAYKVYDIGFHGTPIGRREAILELLKARLGRRFLYIIHAFGRRRKQSMDVCVSDLHIGHSTEPSFPGMRIWQAIATSAAIVTERRDAWPAIEGRHYVAIDHFDPEQPERFLESLEAALHHPLLQIARIAHLELSTYRVERCMKEFLVPASLAVERISG